MANIAPEPSLLAQDSSMQASSPNKGIENGESPEKRKEPSGPEGFYELTVPKPFVSTKVAIVHFAKDLDLHVPSSSLTEEKDLIAAIVSSGDAFPRELLKYFSILKIHSTLPQFFPKLLNQLQENARLGSPKAVKILSKLLPVLRLFGTPGQELSPFSPLCSSAPEMEELLSCIVRENAEGEDASMCVDMAAAVLLLGLPYDSTVQRTPLAKQFSLITCKSTDKWNYQAALMVVYWAVEALSTRYRAAYPSRADRLRRREGKSGAAASPPSSPRKDDPPPTSSGASPTTVVPEEALESSPFRKVSTPAGKEGFSAPENTTSGAAQETEEEEAALEASIKSHQQEGSEGGENELDGGEDGEETDIALCFPNKLPAKPTLPSATILSSLMLCARGLHSSIVVPLAVWTHRSIAEGIQPVSSALALSRLFADHSASFNKFVLGGTRFNESVIMTCLKQSSEILQQAAGKYVASASQAVVPLLRLALVCAQHSPGILTGKDVQMVIADTIKSFIRWYVAVVPYVNPLADDCERAATAKSPEALELLKISKQWKGFNKALALPVYLVLRIGDVLLHDYKAGTPEYIRSFAANSRYLFKQLAIFDSKMHESPAQRKTRRSKLKSQRVAAEPDELIYHCCSYTVEEGRAAAPLSQEDDDKRRPHFLDVLETYLFISDPLSPANGGGTSKTGSGSSGPAVITTMAGLLPASLPPISTRLTAVQAKWALDYNREVVAATWMDEEVISQRAAPTSNLIRGRGSADGPSKTHGGIGIFFTTDGSRQFPWNAEEDEEESEGE